MVTQARTEDVRRHFICVCITIGAMLNFDGDVYANANADVECEQSCSSSHHVRSTVAYYNGKAIVRNTCRFHQSIDGVIIR